MDRPPPPAATNLCTVVVGVPLPDEHLGRLRRRFPEVAFVGGSADLAAEDLDRADAVVAWRLTPDQLRQAPRLRWLQTVSAGVDHVLFPELVEREIVVTNASGLHAPNIAEHVIGMMLAFARDLPTLIRNQDARRWKDETSRDRIFELTDQSLLLVGLGDIGLAVAERAGAFGMRVLGVRRRPGLPVPATVRDVVGVECLPELLPTADHVAISLPLTAGTRHLFNAAMLARCKPSAYLYNVGRGAVVETAALVAALEEGRLAGAGLDVTEPEPLPAESPLWGMPNVLITAHTSGGTPRYWDRALAIVEENVARYLEGRPLMNRVDPAEGY